MMSFVKQIDHVMLYLLFKSTRDWHVNCNVIFIVWNWGFFLCTDDCLSLPINLEP